MESLTDCRAPVTSIPQSEWRAGLTEPSYSRIETEVEHVVVHHSAGSNTNRNYTQVVRDIYIYHTEVNGWSDIGYHYVIKKDGTIEEGRPLKKTGAHVRGANRGTVGVCFVGLNHFTKAQMKAAWRIIPLIEEKVGKKLKLKGHNDYTKWKTCPNFVIRDFLKGKLTIIKTY